MDNDKYYEEMCGKIDVVGSMLQGLINVYKNE